LVRAFGSHPRGHWFESSIAQLIGYRIWPIWNICRYDVLSKAWRKTGEK